MSRFFSPEFARSLRDRNLSLVPLEEKITLAQAEALEVRKATRSFKAENAKDLAKKEAHDDKQTLERVVKKIVSNDAAISQDAVHKGLLQEARDTIAPLAAAGLQRELDRWGNDRNAAPIAPPAIPLIVAMRNLRMNPDLAQQTAKALMDNPQLVYASGQKYYTHIEGTVVTKKDGSTDTAVVLDEAIRSVSPKRAARRARRHEYERDSKLIKRSWLVEKAAAAARKTAAQKRVAVTFITEAEYLKRQAEAANPPAETANPQSETKKESSVQTVDTTITSPAATKLEVATAPAETKDTIDIISKPLVSERVADVIAYFKAKEYMGKPIRGEETFAQRLTALTRGETVLYTIFNCIIFDLKRNRNGREYPIFEALRGEDLSIVGFWKESISKDLEQLESLGKIDPRILIPTNELYDSSGRLWHSEQTPAQKQELVTDIRSDLTKQNDLLVRNHGAQIITWDEFCKEQGLKTPMEYTDEQERRILADPDLLNQVQRQIKRTRSYLAGYIGEAAVNAISDQTILTHMVRYDAMYSGEGKGQAEAGAISANPEETNVAKWNDIGAEGKLALIVPFDPIDRFYTWRAGEMTVRGIGRFARASSNRR